MYMLPSHIELRALMTNSFQLLMGSLISSLVKEFLEILDGAKLASESCEEISCRKNRRFHRSRMNSRGPRIKKKIKAKMINCRASQIVNKNLFSSSHPHVL